jgi:broad specificity phosphatase PhoE
MKLIITRHGETEENLKKIWQGHLPGKLTKKGLEQAKRLANRLRDEKLDVIFSSDLTRASDTAKEIAKFHSEVPIYLVEDLRERFLGELQGQEIKEEIRERLYDEEFCEKNKIETIKDTELRARRFIERSLEDFTNKNILIIGHRGFNSAIIAYLLEKSWEEIFKKESQNSNVTIFELDDNKKPKLVLMNCTKHLENL